jgi:hypothetical protein
MQTAAHERKILLSSFIFTGKAVGNQANIPNDDMRV